MCIKHNEIVIYSILKEMYNCHLTVIENPDTTFNENH